MFDTVVESLPPPTMDPEVRDRQLRKLAVGGYHSSDDIEYTSSTVSA